MLNSEDEILVGVIYLVGVGVTYAIILWRDYSTNSELVGTKDDSEPVRDYVLVRRWMLLILLRGSVMR